MIDWLIVLLNWIIIVECVAIALWYGADLSHPAMRWLFAAFVLLALAFLLFPVPRDFMYAMESKIDGFWFLSRPYTIFPWRIGMATSFGIILLVLRFGKWSKVEKLKDGRG